MKIKSTVWHWLAAGSLCAGLLCGMGLEGNAQVGAPITDGQFVTAMVLVLAAVLLVLTNYVKQTKKLHPIVFIGLSAVVGILFHFGGM